MLFPLFTPPREPPPPTFASLGRAEIVERLPNGVRLRSGRHVVEVAALANDLFRVGLFADGRPVDYRSEAVAKTEWPTPPARVSADGARVETSAATAVLSLNPLAIGFEDPPGREFPVDR